MTESEATTTSSPSFDVKDDVLATLGGNWYLSQWCIHAADDEATRNDIGSWIWTRLACDFPALAALARGCMPISTSVRVLQFDAREGGDVAVDSSAV
ncbi:MAG: hypothetical protein EOO41_01645, partial [Methanobacteriota archaeon]